jgi:hypothetical protein
MTGRLLRLGGEGSYFNWANCIGKHWARRFRKSSASCNGGRFSFVLNLLHCSNSDRVVHAHLKFIEDLKVSQTLHTNTQHGPPYNRAFAQTSEVSSTTPEMIYSFVKQFRDYNRFLSSLYPVSFAARQTIAVHISIVGDVYIHKRRRHACTDCTTVPDP